MCKDCLAAASKRHHGFTGGCVGCCARSIARGKHFARVRKAGVLDGDYRALLAQFKLTHEQVKAAAAADKVGSQT